MKALSSVQWSAMLLLVGWGAVACGGSGVGSSSEGDGRVTLTIQWPSGRAIPAETRSLKIVAKVLHPESGPVVATRVVQRPENQTTSQVVIEDLPSVKVRLTATAHATNDGSGEVIASGSAEVNVPENNSVAASISMTAIDPPPAECPFFMARMRGITATSTDNIASVSGAYAAHKGVFATIFMAGSGEAHSDSVFKVDAPNIQGSFPITLRFIARITDEEPSDDPHSGTVSFSSPVGSHTFNEFIDNNEGEIITQTLNVQHGQVFKVFLDLEITSSDFTGVTATGDLSFENLPPDTRVDDVECGEDD